MANKSLPKPSEAEERLADAIQSKNTSKHDVVELIKNLSATELFIKKSTWLKISQNDSLEKWRRWEAFKLLINRCISYPYDLDNFIQEVIIPQGVGQDGIVDMTMAQSLPIDLQTGEKILMVNLPIATPIGPASVYLAVSRFTNKVYRIGVHPDTF